MKVNGVRISSMAHATEDVSKVASAIGQLSAQGIGPSKIEKMRLRGHYGNEITTLTMSLTGVSAESFFRHLWKRLPKSDQMSLIEGLETRLDGNGRLYLRLDKQAAFLGNFRLGERDSIKLEVSFKNGQDSVRDQPTRLRQLLESERI